MALTSSRYRQSRYQDQGTYDPNAGPAQYSTQGNPSGDPNAMSAGGNYGQYTGGYGGYAPYSNYYQPVNFSNQPYQGYDYSVGPGGGPQTYFPDLTTQDPAIMSTQDRTFGYDRGNRIDYDLANRGQYYDQSQERYRVPMEQAYQDLYNMPGYTPEEQANILQRGNMPQALTQEQVQGLQYTPDEQAAIYGDPNKQRGWFNPAQTEGIARNAAGQAQGALDTWGTNARTGWNEMSENTRAAIGRAQLDPSADYTGMQDKYLGIDAGPTSQYMGMQNQYLGQGAGNMRGLYGNQNLLMDPRYAGTMNQAMAGGEQGVRGYTQDPGLLAGSDYLQNMQFGPEDQQRMVTAAATDIGNATRAERDRVERAASAAGGTAPLALAAAEGDIQRQGDINSADEMLKAQIAAKQLGLNTLQQREATRLGAAQSRAGLGAQSELGLEQARLGGTENIEGTRLGAQQAQTQMGLGAENQIMGAGLGAAGERQGYTSTAAQNLMNAGLAAAGQREGYRSAAQLARMQADVANEQLLGQSRMNAEAGLGQAGIGNAYQGGQLQQAANMYNQNTGIGMEQNIDQTASNRAAAIAGNRQTIGQYGYNTGFGQGMDVNNALSNRYGNIAGQRIAGQGEYRGWLTGQTGQAAQQGTQQRQLRNQAYGTQGDIANTATRNQLTYNVSKPSFGRTFGQSFASAAGGLLGNPYGATNQKPKLPGT